MAEELPVPDDAREAARFIIRGLGVPADNEEWLAGALIAFRRNAEARADAAEKRLLEIACGTVRPPPETTPRPRPDEPCAECGGGPVTHAVFRSGGVFTPPPSGVWTFVCAKCEAAG